MPNFTFLWFLLLSSFLSYNVWFDFILIWVDASRLSLLELEANALLKSGWWSGQNVSEHCEWKSIITCDASGSITSIFVDWPLPIGSTLQNLNFSSLPNLVRLHVFYSNLKERILFEIACLSKLAYLHLSYNNLTGELPLEIGNLTNLLELDLSENMLMGRIPLEIGNLVNLLEPHLNENILTGTIPSTIDRLTNLSRLDLSKNQLGGFIPPGIGNMKILEVLSLWENILIGPIPSSVFQLTNLWDLNLASNKLNGSIPPQIRHSKNFQFMDFSCNLLTRPIPSALFVLVNFRYHHRSYYLEIDLIHNSLDGQIPSIYMNPNYITVIINLSHNKLVGTILDSLSPRLHINLSYNFLQGPVSNQFLHQFDEDLVLGNEKLCGNDFQLHSCHSQNHTSQKILKILLPSFFVFILCFVAFALACSRTMKNVICVTKLEKHGNVLSIWNYDGKIAYKDIIEATEDFHIKYCIGTGGYGSVYRAMLPNDKVIALKKLHTSEAQEVTLSRVFKMRLRC